MTRVLAVGLGQGDFAIEGVEIDTFGLCRAEIDKDRAAFPLYEYDVIIINPQSFSHFIFGSESAHSGSDSELRQLKGERDVYDIDTVFDPTEREAEMVTAIERGATVIWCLSPSQRQNMFGYRVTWMGYCAPAVAKAVKDSDCIFKKGREIAEINPDGPFRRTLELLGQSSWNMCLSAPTDLITSFASTPDGHSLGGRFETDALKGWLLTPPTSVDAARQLISDAVAVERGDPARARYHGIFLSHTSADKPFVRRLRDDLIARGVPVWLDEAEIQIGDSLTEKIEEGMKVSRFIAVILSAKSVAAPWVRKELDIAVNEEIDRGEVVVLPLLYEPCDLPAFLRGKLYADFTTDEGYADTLEKLLRRLRV